jgi:Flp pilus assembly protein TadD
MKDLTRVVPFKIMRPIALATLLGVLTAAIAYAAIRAEWSKVTAGRREVESAEARHAIEDAPICTSISAPALEADWVQLDPDFVAGRNALARREWSNAITSLNFAAVRDPGNADIQNDIGYSYRRLGQAGPAMGHLQQALSLNPRHRGAREQLGELFLALNDPAQAQDQLAALKEICLLPCQEFDSLQQAITAGSRSPER